MHRHPRPASIHPTEVHLDSRDVTAGPHAAALGNEAQELVHAMDWSRTPLGAMSDWAPELRTAVALVLNAPLPMGLFWGPELVQIYNDACIPIFSDGQHPAAMGQRGRDCRQALWPLLEPQLDAVMQGVPARWNADQQLPRRRNGRAEDAWFSYGCLPVSDASGAVKGVLVTGIDTTERVLADRRQRTALAVQGALSFDGGAFDIPRTAMKALRLASIDVPIACFCRRLHPTDAGERASRVVVLARTDDGRLGTMNWPDYTLRDLDSGAAVFVPADRVPDGPMREPPSAHDWLLVPVRTGEAGRRVEVFIAYGLHRRLPVDDGYMEFLSRLTDGISQLIARGAASDAHADAGTRAEKERNDLLMQAPVAATVMVGPEMRFQLVNGRYEELFPGRHLIGRTYAEAFPEVQDTSLPGILEAVYRTGERHVSPEMLVSLLRPDDGRLEDRYLAFNLEPMRNVHGRVYGLIAMVVDVTEQVLRRQEVERVHAAHQARLEADGQQLRETITERTTDLLSANQALLRANAELAASQKQALTATRAKSAFLANMSHEIRTPMSAIVGSTYLLRRHATEPDVLERLDSIANAATHLLRIVNDVLDLSRIEAGKLTLATADFSVESLVAGSCALVADAAREKGLTMRVDMQPMPRVLHGDSMRLSQALVNLLSNAIKYTDEGEVGVTVETVETSPSPDQASAGALIRFVVQDTGPGIPSDRLDSIFDAFERGEDVRERGIGGTGLGLSITRHLVQLMGGEVGAESEPGRGSRFWFTARLLPASGSQHARLQGRRTLLIDDDEDVREALADLLRLLGLEVDMAGSGAEALEATRAARAAGRPYALVLIDRFMPSMDGLDTAQRLLELEGAAPQLALMSAAMDEPMRQAAMRLGITTVLRKPLDIESAGVELSALFERTSDEPDAENSLRSQRVAEAQLRQRHAGARILLVEDDPISQRITADIVRLAGLQVEVAGDGRDAVARVEQGRYDAILMDMHMPVMDGCSAARIIRLLPGGGATPIIAMTASAFNEDRDACLAAGMNDHVGKPVDPAILYDVLSHWLDVHRAPWPWSPEGSAPSAPISMPPRLPQPERTPAEVRRLASLESVEGLSVRQGLDFFAGRVDLYLRALGEFAWRYRDGLQTVDDGNMPGDVGREVHSLGSLAASIGIPDLHAQALALERRHRGGAPDATSQQLLEALDDSLRRLAAALASRLA